MSESKAAPKGIKALGLEGIIAVDSSLSFIDGAKGELLYAGYEIDDLARHVSFEEVAFLLWNDRLPTDSRIARSRPETPRGTETPADGHGYPSRLPGRRKSDGRPQNVHIGVGTL